MKKTVATLLILSTPILLTSCGEKKWSWWEDTNVEIVKYISLSDAQTAVDSSSLNYKFPTVRTYKQTNKSYYKEYLGKFSTETDSDINSSVIETTSIYNNNVIVSSYVANREEAFLNAKSVSTRNIDTYLLLGDNKSITKKTITDYGYGKKIGSIDTIGYTDDDTYLRNTTLGDRMNSSSISWGDRDRVTYGFSKSDDVLVETMSTEAGSYTVKFNNKSLSTFVTNTYCLYRFKPIDKNAENIEYYLDYKYTKVEKLIGSNIFDEPLNEPFLLEKSESSYTYEIKDNADYDTSTIPDVENL